MSTSPDETMNHVPNRVLPRWLLLAVPIVTAAAVASGAAAGVLIIRGQETDRTAGVLAIASALLFVVAAFLTLVILGRTAVSLLARTVEHNASIQQQVSVLAERAVAQQQSPPSSQASLGAPEMRALLHDLRETLLLPEPERERRFQRLVERELQRGLTAAERYILSRDFHRAREELAMLAERFGQDERLRTAHERLEKAAEAARANDLIQANHRIDDLISVARWDEAERVSRELLEKYPVSQDANALLLRVQRERKTYEQRHRQRLFDEVQQFVTQRKWREAAAGAQIFLKNFPSGLDSDALRPQMETLVANADIQARQALEQQLKDLIRQHQYWDALGLARRIISEHPLSPQANALRAQLGRLEELARQSPAPVSSATPAAAT